MRRLFLLLAVGIAGAFASLPDQANSQDLRLRPLQAARINAQQNRNARTLLRGDVVLGRAFGDQRLISRGQLIALQRFDQRSQSLRRGSILLLQQSRQCDNSDLLLLLQEERQPQLRTTIIRLR